MFENFFANFKCVKEEEKKEVNFRKFWSKEKKMEDVKVIENLNVRLAINRLVLVLCIYLFLIHIFHKSVPF